MYQSNQTRWTANKMDQGVGTPSILQTRIEVVSGRGVEEKFETLLQSKRETSCQHPFALAVEVAQNFLDAGSELELLGHYWPNSTMRDLAKFVDSYQNGSSLEYQGFRVIAVPGGYQVAIVGDQGSFTIQFFDGERYGRLCDALDRGWKLMEGVDILVEYFDPIQIRSILQGETFHVSLCGGCLQIVYRVGDKFEIETSSNEIVGLTVLDLRKILDQVFFTLCAAVAK